MKKPKISGYTIFILRCADGSYFSGMTSNLKRKLADIRRRDGIWFSKHPERLPYEIAYLEEDLGFKEATAKFMYLKEMNRRLKEKLINKGIWPFGGPWKDYVLSKEDKNN